MLAPGNEDLVHAGTITGAHGIRGWVRVHVFTDPAENFLVLGRWFAERRSGLEAIDFLTGRRQGKGFVAQIDGVEDRSAAEELRGVQIWARRDDLPRLADDEFYWHELAGMRVYCDHDASELLLGAVDHLIETGANDVLVLRPCEGSVDERERLLPWLPGQVVKKVDRASGCIRVDWHPED